MNKYNVPKKEYENVKQEMNSSSGGGGKVEYYNIINKDNFNSVGDIVMFNMGCSCIIDNKKYIMSAVIAGASRIISICYYPTMLNEYNLGIELSDDFYNAFYKFIKVVSSEMSDEQIKEFFNSTFAPITEEEFYNLD